MKKAGDILREERLRQNRTLEEISVETRVRHEFLQAVEKGEYAQLPDPIYTRGFITSYARSLGLDESTILPFYRREVEQKQGADVAKIPTPLGVNHLNITPGKLVVGAVIIMLTVFTAVLFWQYRSFAGAPLLIVDFPSDNYITDQASLEVSGRTDPRATVNVNGEPVEIEITGHFKITFRLNEGTNRIKTVAENELGKQTVVERLVEQRNADVE